MKINSPLKFILKYFYSVLLLQTIELPGLAQQKRIYIANDDHIDYLWSADESIYRKAFINMLDFYIRKADSTIAIGLPYDQQSRFNCDGSLWLWTYEQNKTPAEGNRLIPQDAYRSQTGSQGLPSLVGSCM